MSQHTEKEKGTQKRDVKRIILYIICGISIGLGAVLPGISGGVLCVIFGIYRPLMDFLSNPIKTFKKRAKILIPALIGIAIGFFGISKVLGFLMDKYPDQSVCAFIGLIFGMLPELFKDAGKHGRSAGSFVSLGITFLVVLGLLIGLKLISFNVVGNIWWYLFCGFCMAISIIVPGMSFSTLLMPLGLYTPLINGIGNLNLSVLLPAGIGAVVTIILLAKLTSGFIEKHYSIAFHGIIGIVIAATLVIIPFDSFTAGISRAIVSGICLIAGAAVSLLFSAMSSKIGRE